MITKYNILDVTYSVSDVVALIGTTPEGWRIVEIKCSLSAYEDMVADIECLGDPSESTVSIRLQRAEITPLVSNQPRLVWVPYLPFEPYTRRPCASFASALKMRFSAEKDWLASRGDSVASVLAGLDATSCSEEP